MGGETVYFKGDREYGIKVEELKEFLEKDNCFKYATIVHCDTPSGVLNPVGEICKVLKRYGIMTVVDAVSSIGGEEIKVDQWQIDICLGGSQKALSAPPGLTFLSISQDAWKAMEDRGTPVAGFYCNLSIWKDYYEKKWFPYTMPISDIKGLAVAVENTLSEDAVERHRVVAEAFRKAIVKGGLELYTKDCYSNTVSVIKVPEGIDEEKLREDLLNKYNLLIAGAFGYLSGRVIRVGHMGEGSNEQMCYYTLNSLEEALKEQGFQVVESMGSIFFSSI